MPPAFGRPCLVSGTNPPRSPNPHHCPQTSPRNWRPPVLDGAAAGGARVSRAAAHPFGRAHAAAGQVVPEEAAGRPTRGPPGRQRCAGGLGPPAAAGRCGGLRRASHPRLLRQAQRRGGHWHARCPCRLTWGPAAASRHGCRHPGRLQRHRRRHQLQRRHHPRRRPCQHRRRRRPHLELRRPLPAWSRLHHRHLARRAAHLRQHRALDVPPAPGVCPSGRV